MATFRKTFRKRSRRTLGATPVSIDETLGGKIFQWLHPEQVQSEYDMQAGVGHDAPRAPVVDLNDVLQTARRDVMDTAARAGEAFSAGAKLATTALVAGAIIYALHTFSGKRR